MVEKNKRDKVKKKVVLLNKWGLLKHETAPAQAHVSIASRDEVSR
jgi:hypothetical protein